MPRTSARTSDLPRFAPCHIPRRLSHRDEKQLRRSLSTSSTEREPETDLEAKSHTTRNRGINSFRAHLFDFITKVIGTVCALVFGIWAPLSYQLQKVGNEGNDAAQEEVKKLRGEVKNLGEQVRLMGILRAVEVCGQERGKELEACRGLTDAKRLNELISQIVGLNIEEKGFREPSSTSVPRQVEAREIVLDQLEGLPIRGYEKAHPRSSISIWWKRITSPSIEWIYRKEPARMRPTGFTITSEEISTLTLPESTVKASPIGSNTPRPLHNVDGDELGTTDDVKHIVSYRDRPSSLQSFTTSALTLGNFDRAPCYSTVTPNITLNGTYYNLNPVIENGKHLFFRDTTYEVNPLWQLEGLFYLFLLLEMSARVAWSKFVGRKNENEKARLKLKAL